MSDRINIFPSRGAQTLMKGKIMFENKILHFFLAQVGWRELRQDTVYWRRKLMRCSWSSEVSWRRLLTPSSWWGRWWRKLHSRWPRQSLHPAETWTRLSCRTSTRLRSRSRPRMTMLLESICQCSSVTRTELTRMSWQVSPREVNSWSDWRRTIRKLSTCWWSLLHYKHLSSPSTRYLLLYLLAFRERKARLQTRVIFLLSETSGHIRGQSRRRGTPSFIQIDSKVIQLS